MTAVIRLAWHVRLNALQCVEQLCDGDDLLHRTTAKQGGLADASNPYPAAHTHAEGAIDPTGLDAAPFVAHVTQVGLANGFLQNP